MLLFLSLVVAVVGIIFFFYGYASALLCAVILIVLIWYLSWHNDKQKVLEKELEEIKEKLDSLSNDKTDKE